MPIKFRCSHCQQFLGISRSRSGSIVDCPSCGRSIRVPNLDGTVEPIPQPAINLGDADLAGALSQLAELNFEPPPAASTASAPPPVVAPMPIAVVQDVIIEAGSPSDGGENVSQPGVAQPWVEVEEQLTSLAASAPVRDEPALSRRITRREVVVGLAASAITAPVAWWLGRRSMAVSSSGAPEVPVAPVRAESGPVAEPEPSPSLTGRITYVTAEGESRPDAGARVLVLPEQRPGSTLLSVEGFRAHAAAADLQLAREAIRLYGGAYEIADEQGRYAAMLSSSGAYQILIVSNYQPRPAAAVPPEVLKSLGRYFERPQLLIGQTAYEFVQWRYSGREPAVRDQVFARV
jgi:hypothetical protein